MGSRRRNGIFGLIDFYVEELSHQVRDWRFFTRELFETAFEKNFIVTDFVFDPNNGNPRGLYILTHGESTLDEFE